MEWFLLLLMATACAASTYQISVNANDCVYIFSKSSNTDNMQLVPLITTFHAVTVCLRAKTDLCRDHTLFSAAEVGEDNAIRIEWDADDEDFDVYIGGHKIEYKGLTYDLNKWNSICITWDSATGLVQLFFNGHKTIKEYVGRDKLTHLNMVLGQDQDNYGGGFNEHECFQGEIYEVNVWDYVLGDCHILDYMQYKNYCPGNSVSWRNLTFYLTGDVVKAKRQVCFQADPKDVYPEISVGNDYEYYRNDYSPSFSQYNDYYSGIDASFGYYSGRFVYGKSYYGNREDLVWTGFYGNSNTGKEFEGNGYRKGYYGYGYKGYYGYGYRSYYDYKR